MYLCVCLWIYTNIHYLLKSYFPCASSKHWHSMAHHLASAPTTSKIGIRGCVFKPFFPSLPSSSCTSCPLAAILPNGFKSLNWQKTDTAENMINASKTGELKPFSRGSKGWGAVGGREEWGTEGIFLFHSLILKHQWFLPYFPLFGNTAQFVFPHHLWVPWTHSGTPMGKPQPRVVAPLAQQCSALGKGMKSSQP